VEQFMKEEHSFEDYSKEVMKYTNLAQEIAYNSQKVC